MKNDRPPECKIEIFVTINCEFSLSRLILTCFLNNMLTKNQWKEFWWHKWNLLDTDDRWLKIQDLLACTGYYYPARMRKGLSNRFCLSVVVTKIARSPHLGIWATRKYNESAEIGGKLASLARPTSVTNTAFYWPRLSTAGHHAHKSKALCR